ncbi:MAG: hypothetical protein CML66_19960 [Rhodobacteraceae bacterium]|nr:hypothetical protein [Paracoccaceae bacterium]MAY47191.1 hypothetical protein [Paracoccaceae bacterium]
MPIIALQPWSQFTRADEESMGSAGSIVFNGGASVPLILRTPTGGGTLELEQAVQVDGTGFPCGAVVSAPAEAMAPDVRTGHVLALDDTPVGICLDAEHRLQPGDLVIIGDKPALALPQTEPHDGILCFAAGTQIETPSGPRRVETLRPGEIVATEDRGPQPLLWSGRREVLFTRGDNRHRPILFRPGSLGPNLPERDLVVSPDHHLVVRGPDVAELTGNFSALAPAGALAELRGARQMLGKRRITYVHLMLETHAILKAEGADAESYYPTPAALATLSDSQRSSIFGHIPALRIAPETAYGPTALPMIDWPSARRLATRRKSETQGASDVQKLATG